MQRQLKASRDRRSLPKAPARRACAAAAAIEPLEGRILLALLNLPIDFSPPPSDTSPIIDAASNNEPTMTYAASSGKFDVTAPVLRFVTDPFGRPASIDATDSDPSSPLSSLEIFVDSTGHLLHGSTTGTDLQIIGHLDVGATTYDGVLLTGHIVANPPDNGFGFNTPDATTGPAFDFRFRVTGGLLQDDYFTGMDIGVYLTPFNTNYAGTFTGDFSGVPEMQIGPIRQLAQPAIFTSPTLTTTASASNAGAVGTAILTDTAVLSGLSGGAHVGIGSIFFTLTAPDNTTTVLTANVNGNGTYSVSTALPATQVGTYVWSAFYAGDDFNNGAVDQADALEQVTIKAVPALATQASESYAGVVGSAILGDTATLSGGHSPTGTITFTLTRPDGTTGPAGSVNVTGDNTYAAPTVLATEVGTYTWHATYSGDALNEIAADNGAHESLITVAASTTLSTQASQTSGGVVGSAILTDTAVLSGGYQVGVGSILFTLTAPDGTQCLLTAAVNGDGTYSVSTLLPATQVGTYTWTAHYTGDALNNGADDQHGALEQVTTIKASPALTTVASSVGTLAGTALLGDQATLSGGYLPGGNILFTLTWPDGSVINVGSVAVTGAGIYSAPSVPAAQAGKYTWHATYTGDPLNNGAGDDIVNESVTIQAPATISGAKYLDLTGNGFSSDDPGLGGVTINLYRADGTTLVATTTTAASGVVGSYSFPNLVAGNYVVKEVLASGYLETGPALGSSYAVTASAGASLTNVNFDNYQQDCDLTDFTNISYSINGTRTVASLSGNTHAGDVVTVTFTVANNVPPHQLTLVSYIAPGPTFNANTAAQQTIYAQATGTFGPGVHTLTVQIPDSYYEIDFVCGPAIDHFGPAGSNIFYSAQGRLIGTDNGGTIPPVSNPGTLSGVVFDDCNDNGIPDAGETPLGGVIVTLNGPGGLTLTHVTAPDGSYTFSNLPAGTYSITTTTPTGFLTGKETLGKVANTNTTVGSITTANSMGNINLGAGQKLVGYYSGELEPASLSGFVYVDLNNNGLKDPIEQGIGGAKVTLSGTNDLGAIAPIVLTTQADGSYSFTNLRPGTYAITETTPTGFVDGKDMAGTLNGVTDGVAANDLISLVQIAGCASNGINYNFGEQVPPTPVGAGQFATIGFWHNGNGLSVINSFNGSSASKLLGNWLAACFPHLFGAPNPYTASTLASLHVTSLAGLTNAQVASVYNGLWTPNGTPKNTYVQAFAVALGLYADTLSLGGASLLQNGLATKFGFKVTPAGAGAFNIGSNGAAFGVANGSVVQVWQILQTVDANFSPATGLFFGGSQAYTSMANNVLNGINTGGDITLVSSDSVSVGATQPLVTQLHPLQSGTLVLAVDALPGDAAQVASEQARIDAAVTSLNGILGPRGVTYVEIHGDDSVPADVHLHFSSTSDIGGVDQGILGVTDAQGEITIITGWNYNLGADAAPLAANQFDFQTVITHELGHALGLGHSADGSSVMFPYLGAGEFRHALTAGDLAIIDSNDAGAPEPLRARVAAAPSTWHSARKKASTHNANARAAYATAFSAMRIQGANDTDADADVLLGKHHRHLLA